MNKKVLAAAFVLVASLILPAASLAQSKTSGKPAAKVDTSACYGCHAPIKEFHAEGKHKGVSCASCHSGLEQHLASSKQRPVTRVDHQACGTCHQPQYQSFFTMNWKKLARDEKSQATGKSPNPAWDLLMMPHGFTREHNLQRTHSHMLFDHLVVDRAYGGRFQPADGGRHYANEGDYKAWDKLVDLYPNEADQKIYKHGAGAFANPVCLNCKTQDHILDWAFMGDPVPGAAWSRTSKVTQFAKTLNHSLNCFMCHDPHSAKPRIVRDALIQALTRPEADTLWHKDPKRTKIDVKDMGLRGFTRKIAILEKTDTKLQCGQCHVEYNCNPGIDPTDGKPVGMADQRTNHFPFKDVWEMQPHYNSIKFRDFRHGVTGALLWKAQHPEAETFWNSKHDKAGVQCHHCHMPKVKDPKTGKTYTSHWQTNPKNYLKETCLTCHANWDETKAKYVIESSAARFAGKARKAEFWLVSLVNKFDEARQAGVSDEDALKKAREKHDAAHIHWEWWVAETSKGFHNMDQTLESLNTSMIRSQEGIAILDEATKAKRGTDSSWNTPVKAKAFIGVDPVR